MLQCWKSTWLLAFVLFLYRVAEINKPIVAKYNEASINYCHVVPEAKNRCPESCGFEIETVIVSHSTSHNIGKSLAGRAFATTESTYSYVHLYVMKIVCLCVHTLPHRIFCERRTHGYKYIAIIIGIYSHNGYVKLSL